MSNDPKAPNFAYLAEKEPSSLHLALAAFIKDHGGPEMDPKQVQAVLSAHGKFQASDHNKRREDYKPRTPQSIYKGGVTTAANFHFVVDEDGVEVRVEGPKPEPKAAPKKAAAAKPEPKAAPAAKAAPRRRTPAKKAPAAAK